MILLSIFLSLLLSVCIGAIVAQRKTINILFFSLSNINDYTRDLREVTEDFNNHLESFNSMENYMGEPIVEDLLKHSRFVVERVKEIHSSLEIKNNFSKEENNIGRK